MANIVKLTATYDDGSTNDIYPVQSFPPVATITEVDVLLTDSNNTQSTKKFVPDTTPVTPPATTP